MPYITFVHPEDVEKTLEYETKPAPAVLMNRFQCRDGSYRWLDWIGLSVLREQIPEKESSFILSVARDITLQKIVEKELAERVKKISDDQLYKKQQFLESIVEIQAVHINSIFYEDDQFNNNRVFKIILQNLIKFTEGEFGFIVDNTSNQIRNLDVHYIWNENFSLIGSDNEQEKLQKLEGVFNIFIKDIASKKEPLIINDIKNYSKNIELLVEPCQLKSFLGVPLIIQDKLKGIIGLSNCAQDINEELMLELDSIFSLAGHIIKETKERLNRKEFENQKLEREKKANLEKSNFLAHMSHEIRTPLTGLMGMLDLINTESLSKNDLNYLQIAHSSGVRLLTLLNDILDTSKIEAGHLTFENVKFNPVEIAQEVTQLLLLEAQKKEIGVKLIINSPLPLFLMGDPTRVRQIFFNLVSNAIKFTQKGNVFISLDGAYKNDHFDFCAEVTDTGIGLSPEAQEKLFMSFSQGDKSMFRRFGGSGLGLFITRKICEGMGGGISVSSEVGKGSSFSFHVKLEKVKELSPIRETLSPIELPDKLPNIKVLLAEDNAVNQLILKMMLTKAGCSVTAVWNGLEAVEAVNNNHYDIVLMDGEMPLMDGLEATRKIRENFLPEMLPIIAVTAHAMLEDREKFLKAGMTGYLTKPIQKEALYTEILKNLHFVSSHKKENQ